MSGEDENVKVDNEETIQQMKTKNKSIIERKLPVIDCDLHVLFVIDVCFEEDSAKFKMADGSEKSSLTIIKKAVSVYINNKHAINPRHTYGLMSMGENPVWIQTWTTPAEIMKKLKEVKETECPRQCNLTPVFDMIREKVTLLLKDPPTVDPIDHIVQTIFIYGRSNCIPELLDGKESCTELSINPIYYFDVLYIHDNPSDDNKCEGIFEILCNLDVAGWGYSYEVSKDVLKCLNSFSKFLAHPLQRPMEDERVSGLSKMSLQEQSS